MHTRIKKVRKTLDLTQQEFADSIGSKRNTVATYELGRIAPSAAVISLICKTFNVSERWLRTGEGEMFNQPQSRKDEIQRIVEQMMEGRKAEFKYRLISVLNRLDEDQWGSLEDYLREILDGRSAVPEQAPLPAKPETEQEIDQEVERYRQQLLSEKIRAAQTSSVKESDVG